MILDADYLSRHDQSHGRRLRFQHVTVWSLDLRRLGGGPALWIIYTARPTARMILPASKNQYNLSPEMLNQALEKIESFDFVHVG